MNLAQRARIAADVSQRTFALMLGTSQSVVSRWEAGAVTPSGPIRRLLELIVEHPESVPDWLAELFAGSLETAPKAPSAEGVDATSTKA